MIRIVRIVRIWLGHVKGNVAPQLLIETSAQDTYAATSRFYERAGYNLVARLPEYYKAGDDKLVYGKRLVTRS